MDVALCLQDFPSEIAEKSEKPEIELSGYDEKTRPLCLNPIYLARYDKEKCLIESSINSCRVYKKLKKNSFFLQFISLL